MIQSLPARNLLYQLPTRGMSLVIAEVFYRFHRFTLECVAFLVTWYVLGLVRKFVMGGLRH